MENEFEDYTDEELTKSWNRLETLKFSPSVEVKMDKIEEELRNRRVIAWNDKGEITHRD